MLWKPLFGLVTVTEGVTEGVVINVKQTAKSRLVTKMSMLQATSYRLLR
jgi:RNA-binding protein YhbY